MRWEVVETEFDTVENREMKTVEQHIANLERMHIAVLSPSVVTAILEMLAYEKYKPITALINKATTVVLDRDECVSKIVTRFGVFKRLRDEYPEGLRAGGIDPITQREILETGLYARIYGIEWYVNRTVPSDTIIVFSNKRENGEPQIKQYTFRIVDEWTIEEVPNMEILTQ